MVFWLNPTLIIEELGDELLICDTEYSLVHRLEGEPAHMVKAFRAHGESPCEMPPSPTLDALVGAGIVLSVIPTESDQGSSMRLPPLSRRKLMRYGAVATTVGLATLALPEAAAAQSVPDIPPSAIDGGGGATEVVILSPQWSFGTSTGIVRVRWSWDNFDFSSTYSVHAGGYDIGAPLASGPLLSNATTFSTIYTISTPGSTVYVTLKSITNPVITEQRPFTRPNPT